MSVVRLASLRVLAIALATLAATLFSASVSAAEKVSFSEDIYPIIQIRCLECHQPQGEGYEKSGLDLRTYEGLMKGTKFGPMVIPGDAFMSNLIVLIDGRARAGLRMPHGKKKLNSCDRRLFRSWINQGAKNN